MGRFDRFKKLERARPDAPGEAPAKHAQRFGKIEARQELPTPAKHDPFAPPPEGDVPLEVAADDQQDLARQRAAREARALAQLDAEAMRLAELRMRQEAQHGRSRAEAVLNLSVRHRAYILVGLLAAIGVLAAAVGPIAWGLAPFAIVAFAVSLLAKRA